MNQFDKWPAHSRVWIYQSNRKLNEYETISIQDELKNFTAQWQAHQMQLVATAAVVYNRFIVFIVDENQTSASGCSIDKSVNLIKQIGSKFDIDFFDRLSIAYQQESVIALFELKDFNELIRNGELTADTLIYNNLVSTKEELLRDWQIPIKESWLSKRLANLSI